MKSSPAMPDDVLALLAEVAALVRAGIPLEPGLKASARSLPKKLGKLADDLTARLEQGESLEAILADPAWRLPPEFAAVVAAGARGGDLAHSLEQVADSSTQLRELDRALGRAWVYPLVIALLAYGVWLLVLVNAAPVIERLVADSHVAPHWLLAWALPAVQTWHVWAPPLPIVVLLAFAAWRWQRRWRWPAEGERAWPLFAGIRQVRRQIEQARFTEMLALLVGQQTPLPEALALAARASGSAPMQTAAAPIVEAIERGEPLATAWPRATPLPSLTRWLLVGGANHADLAATLRQAAGRFRAAATRQAALLNTLYPIVLLVAVGGSVALVSALSLFVPLSDLYQKLSQP